MATTTEPDVLLTRFEVADILRVSHCTVSRMNTAGKIPAPVMLGSRTKWKRSVILAWVDAGCPSRAVWEATLQAAKKAPRKRR
jgi:predicted DNA-binding transcriptional regulator AlpA